VARRYAGRVTILGVAGRDDTEAMQAFVDRHGLGQIRHAADLEGLVWERFGVVAQPVWVFIDGETGELRRHVGELTVDQLDAALAKLSR
jgi:hypothetical protein